MKLLAISFAALILSGAMASAEVDEWGDSGDCLNQYQRPIRVTSATGNNIWMSVNTRTKFCRGGYTNGLMGEIGEGGNNGDSDSGAAADGGDTGGSDCEGGEYGGGEGGPK